MANENDINEMKKRAYEKALIEAEAKAKVEAEMKMKQKEEVLNAKPSPEEIALKTDKMMRVTVSNVEFPGADISFVYGGKSFNIHDGEELELPYCVIDFLNGIRIPDYKWEETAEGGRHISKVKRQRVTCMPVNIGAIRK